MPILARSFALVAFILLPGAPARGEVSLRKGCVIEFTSVSKARELLTREDDFIQRLSPFDRAARMKTDRPVSKAELLKFIGGAVLEWSAADKQKIETAIAKIRPALEALPLKVPKTVYLVKTSGAEEGKAFYTRGTTIVFPEPQLTGPSEAPLEKTIAHELFHVLSRNNPSLREKLYETIGFKKADELALPAQLKDRKITNPDAPRNDHAIRLKFKGREVSAVPILFSSTEQYDPKRGGEFFNYLQFKFMMTPSGELVEPKEVTGFFEQVGRNTDYIIHPEEILADNFALLVTGKRDVSSPEILQRVEQILKQGE